MGDKKLIASIIVMGFLSQATTVAARADDFCTALKAVGADVTGGFANIRGAAMGPAQFESDDGKIETTFRVSRILSGATNCNIKWQTPDEVRPKGWGYYQCSFASNPTNVETVSAIAIEVSECTGVKARSSDVEIDKDEDEMSVRFFARSYTVSLYSRPDHRIVLVVD